MNNVHQCSGVCSCGTYRTRTGPGSVRFALSNRGFDEGGTCPVHTPSSVDCTLSLATPSTLAGDRRRESSDHRSSCMSIFGRNMLPAPSAAKANDCGGDPLLARRCASCNTTSTPLWRNGPRGPKSLCNACGIRFKKEERRASAAVSGGDAQLLMDLAAHPPQTHKTTPFSVNGSHAHEFRFLNDVLVEDYRRDSDTGGIPFLSWRFNVADRSGLVHDFTT